jgi:hypothetical protein
MLLTPLPVELGGPLPDERARVAFTAWFDLMLTTHEFGPEQPAPDQPANAEPDLGVGVSVRCDPWPTIAEHVPGQEMPAGLLVTDPEPLPLNDTFSARRATKLAVTA